MQFSTHLGSGTHLGVAVMTSIHLRDVISGVIKSVAFALIIVTAGCLKGFPRRGRPLSGNLPGNPP